jgi:2-C-methyl-D-erythritol 4-phosphate cytidylyltransferase
VAVESYWLVLAAAGSGRRMHEGRELPPKQYWALAGATVIEHALAPFLGDRRCQGVVIALAAGDRWWPQLSLSRDPRIATVTGGARRQDSVAAALAALAGRVGPADPWVLVHDAARPCVSRAEIDALLAALDAAPDGALLGLALVDTVKRAGEDRRVRATLEREQLWRALTPQAFRLRALAPALAVADTASDEASAIERQGGAPLLVPGSPCNIKLTGPADIGLAARILAGEPR